MNAICRRALSRLSAIVLLVSVAACGGSSDTPAASPTTSQPNTTTATPTPTYSVGGTVTGLASGASVTLSNTANNDTVTVSGSGNGSFTFPTAIPAGGSYTVKVGTQPGNQTCTVGSNATGTVGSANVTGLSVTCSTNTVALSGTVAGLPSGQSLSVSVNGTAYTINGTGSSLSSSQNISLGTVAAGSSYNVTLPSAWSSPMAAASLTYCYVASNGTGTPSSDVSNIAITCNYQSGPPTTIALNGTQHGVSYSGWSLQYPYTVTLGGGQVEVYYQVMYSGSPYSPTILPNGTGMVKSVSGTNGAVLGTNMDTLQMLFNGSTSPAMNATGDPSTVTPGYASNVTTLQSTNYGAVTVAIPTGGNSSYLGQLGSIYSAAGVPPGWDINGIYLSSTVDGSGRHDGYTLSAGFDGGGSDSYSVGADVAFQVP